MTLFKIGDEFRAWYELADETGGEIRPEDQATFDAWADGLVEDEAHKLEGYCGLIRALESEAAVAKAEAEQFEAKSRARARRVEWLKYSMKAYMESRGVTKLTTSAGRTISVQANGGKLGIDYAADATPASVPKNFAKVKLEYDTDKIREALESGASLDFASLKPRGTQLRIR